MLFGIKQTFRKSRKGKNEEKVWSKTEKPVKDDELIRYYRAILRRKNLRIIEQKRKINRRISFFSFMFNDRRFIVDRRAL